MCGKYQISQIITYFEFELLSWCIYGHLLGKHYGSVLLYHPTAQAVYMTTYRQEKEGDFGILKQHNFALWTPVNCHCKLTIISLLFPSPIIFCFCIYLKSVTNLKLKQKLTMHVKGFLMQKKRETPAKRGRVGCHVCAQDLSAKQIQPSIT